MKKGILFLFILSSAVAQSQSLRDALFSGKLKSEPGTVIRKGDDLSTKKDTASKVQVIAIIPADSIKATQAANKPAAVQTSVQSDTKETTEEKPPVTHTQAATAAATESPAVQKADTPKDNNAIWKEHMTGFAEMLKADVLSNKKIKEGTYYVSIFYAIGTDGDVEITDVLLSPEHKFLHEQIKNRLVLDTPKLQPVLSSSGAARKVTRKYNFTLTKE